MTDNPILRDALFYDARGITCVPIRIKGNKKKAAVRWKEYQTRRPTEDELRGWFDKPRAGRGVAVITGAASRNLAICDFDNRKQQGAYERWRDRNATLARELPTARTLDGIHVWHTSDLQRTLALIDGEFRGGPTLTVAPHSMRDSFRYEWVIPLPSGPLPIIPHEVFTGTRIADSKRPDVTETYRMPCSVSLCPSLSFSVTSIDDAITRTLPTKVGERNLCLLNLARALKFNLGMDGAGWKDLHAIVRRWHTRALPVIGTKDLEITLLEFDHAFKRARHPLGLDVVDQAALRIDPLELPPAALAYEGSTTRRLVALCHQLASLNNQRFFLSCADAAVRLRITRMQVWRLLRMLETDGVIHCEQRGNERRATRYRFIAPLPLNRDGNDE